MSEKKYRTPPPGGVLMASLLLIAGCTLPPLGADNWDSNRMKDGIYHGAGGGTMVSALVQVVVEDHKIIDIVILEHNTLLGGRSENILIEDILETQSTHVDAVTGATYSSHAIINAVKQALGKACGE